MKAFYGHFWMQMYSFDSLVAVCWILFEYTDLSLSLLLTHVSLAEPAALDSTFRLIFDLGLLTGLQAVITANSLEPQFPPSRRTSQAQATLVTKLICCV